MSHATATTVGHRLNLGALQSHLLANGVHTTGSLSAELIAGGKSNLTYVIADHATRWVLRMPPRAGRTPSAHDVAREFRVTSGLQASEVPVPRPLLLCEDDTVLGAPFTVVEHIDGRTVRTGTDLEQLSDEEIERCVADLVRILALLHRVEPGTVGLEDFGRPDGYLQRQVTLWSTQWARVRTRDSPDVERLRAALTDAVPSTSSAAVVHGDYRIDNTLLRHDDPGSVTAVLDWEMSTLGDPLADVALMCVYRNPAMDLIIGEPAAWTSPRMPAAPDLAHRYATAAGLDLPHWPFYLALAHYKVAVIAEGIHHRHALGATYGPGFDRAGEAVAAFAAGGLHALGTPT